MSFVKFNDIIKKYNPDLYKKNESYKSSLSLKIMELRISSNMDFYEFAKFLKLTPEKYIKFEYGDTDIPTDEYETLIDHITYKNELSYHRKRVNNNQIKDFDFLFKVSSIEDDTWISKKFSELFFDTIPIRKNISPQRVIVSISKNETFYKIGKLHSKKYSNNVFQEPRKKEDVIYERLPIPAN